MQCHPILLEIVQTLHPPARLAGRLNGGQQQSDERADDGDDDQQLDERETRFVAKSLRHGGRHRGQLVTAEALTTPTRSLDSMSKDCGAVSAS